ncbi:ISC system 2Fe-2S type ferredoxin [Candidatus Vallotiella sp. (ex Adelges kitamiensis)]|uniref:ISC system 2Fe-2S type ferredoxin n=1 Tax=Candidatus Vallotiella sp. (ex Adelges kitamiensis) TaxID=2864217 RepID=UPI001CE309D5|nr:ISC system 2Fe-2S type ferredoxin [Candidatus Vallotia sp. (ex Adelges kitamiensis)]
MSQIVILPHIALCPEGAVFEAEPSMTICDMLLDSGIEIEHACEKSCACTTCHIIIREGFNALEQPQESEDNLLDKAWGVEPTSRLACQAKLVKNEDLVIEIPKYSVNFNIKKTIKCRKDSGSEVD